MKVFIATSTFGDFSNESIDHLRQNELDVCLNKLGRKLTDNELIKFAEKCDSIIAGTENYSRRVLERLPHLKVISRLGIGMDNIDIEATKNKGIKIYKTKTTPAPAVAELVLALMIDVSRHISHSNQLVKNGNWNKKMGFLLFGKTLGIIGLGTIGKELVKVSKGFGFHILAFDKQEDVNFADEHDVTYCDLYTLLSKSHFISIHLNLSDETKYFIDEEKIKLMNPESILINTSRGEVLDEKALYGALKTEKLGGAGLDVFHQEPYSGPLTGLDNVVLTPHIGAYAKELRIQMEIEAVENLIRGLNES